MGGVVVCGGSGGVLVLGGGKVVAAVVGVVVGVVVAVVGAVVGVVAAAVVSCVVGGGCEVVGALSSFSQVFLSAVKAIPSSHSQ